MKFVSVRPAANGGLFRTVGIFSLFFLMNGVLSGCTLGYLAVMGQHDAAVKAAQGNVDPKSPVFLDACKRDAGVKIYEVARDVHGYVSLPSVNLNEDGSPMSGEYGSLDTVGCGLCGSLLQSRWDFQEKKIVRESYERTVHTTARSGTQVNSRRSLIRSTTYTAGSFASAKRKELASGLGWTRYIRVKRPSQLCARFDSLGGKSAAVGYEDACIAAISISQPTARYEFQSYRQPIYVRVPDRDGKIHGAYISRSWAVIRDRKNGKTMAEAVSYSFQETVGVASLLAGQDSKYGHYTTGFGSCGTSNLPIEEVLIPARPKT